MTSETNTTSEHSDEHEAAGTVILFLSFAVLLACIMKIVLSQVLKNKFPIPFTVVVLLLGFIIGIVMAHLDSAVNDFLLGERQLRSIEPHLIYYIFLPLLIFDSSFNSHFHVVQQQIVAGILLAGPGVLVCMVIVAICSIYIFPYDWEWLDGLIFGSILSATDPVAVVALLHESGASKSLAALIDLESLFNDGSAFVLFLIFRDILVNKGNVAKAIFVGIAKFTLGGPAFGLACGIIAVFVLNLVNNELEIEIISTFGLAYLVFYIADVEIGVSAVLASVVMGLFMAKHKYCISSHAQLPMASIWRMMIYFVNIMIFFITGIILAQSIVGSQAYISGRDFGYTIVLYITIHVARLAGVVVLYPFIKWSKVRLSLKEYIVLIWSGLRGSMSMILALLVLFDDDIGDEEKRKRFLFHICMIALLTLIINGTSSKFLVRWFKLDQGTPESESVLLRALEHMRSQTTRQLDLMKEQKEFVDVDWNMLTEYLPEKLVQEMDDRRRTTIHRRLSAVPTSLHTSPQASTRGKPKVQETELLELPTTYRTNDQLELTTTQEQNDATHADFVLPVMDLRSTDDQGDQNMRNELVTRFLSALAVDYEKQWYIGMIRRPTLYVLINSVEKAKHQYSMKLHWESIVSHFRLSFILQHLMRFDYAQIINEQVNKLLFDHIFLTIELVLAFHSARTRMENIRIQFPELASINENIWNEVTRELQNYQNTASYILLDLEHSYQRCWRIQMTKRCAQILLKFESTAITELYETGMLGETEYTHILGLIEKKIFDLEFYRVKMPNGGKKAIANGFDLLPLFKLIPVDERHSLEATMKAVRSWYQPNTVLIAKDQEVTESYLIIRGIVALEQGNTPIYYRSGNIIGVDALFASTFTANGTYSVMGGLLEAYKIDQNLLNRLLDDQYLTAAVYREIALHVLSNRYQSMITLNRSQIKQLLQKKAKFHLKPPNLSIILSAGTRFLLLCREVTDDLDGTSPRQSAVDFRVIDSQEQIHLDNSSVAYTWTVEDENSCVNSNSKQYHFPAHMFGSIAHALRYPGYSAEIEETSGRRKSMHVLQQVGKFNDIPASTVSPQTMLQHNF